MRKKTKQTIFIAVILALLIPIAFLAHKESLDIPAWDGNQVFIKVCYPGGAHIEIIKCEDWDDICVNPSILFVVDSDRSPTRAFIKLKSGFYTVSDGREYREFIVTRNSPDRYEYFGCESEPTCYDKKGLPTPFNLKGCR